MRYFNQKWYVRCKLVKEIEMEYLENKICSELKLAEQKLSSRIVIRPKRLMELSQLRINISRRRLMWTKRSTPNFATNVKRI